MGMFHSPGTTGVAAAAAGDAAVSTTESFSTVARMADLVDAVVERDWGENAATTVARAARITQRYIVSSCCWLLMKRKSKPTEPWSF
jgi:hypothetical protein